MLDRDRESIAAGAAIGLGLMTSHETRHGDAQPRAMHSSRIAEQIAAGLASGELTFAATFDMQNRLVEVSIIRKQGRHA